MGSGEKRAVNGWSHTRVLLLAAGVTATLVAWGVLVFAAIDFGRSARAGQDGDWLFLGLATVGGVACMFLAIVLAARLQAMVRGNATRPHSAPTHQHTGPSRPKGAPAGGKRAAR